MSASIAADSALLTYAEAGQRVGKGVAFIRARVQSGELVGTDLGYNCKRIAEHDLQRFLNNSRTLDHRRK